MPADADAVTVWVLGGLLAGSLQGTVLIALAWFASRGMPKLPPSWLAVLWWLAALKLLVAFVPVAAVSIPLLPAGTQPITDLAELARVDIGDAKQDTSAVGVALAEQPADATNDQTNRSAVGTSLRTLVVVWYAGLALHGLRLLSSFRKVRTLVRASVLAAPEDMELVARLADALRLRSVPQVRASSSIETPQLTGVRRPIVLMPLERTLTPDERAMALCHELLHIRRHDLVLGWVPAIAERLFFFHPLARVAAREYVTAREVACDADVVRTLGVSPAIYARLLLRIGVAERRTVFAAGGASSSMSSLKRRLEMLQHVGDTAKPHSVICSIAVVLIAAMMPFQLVANESSPDRQRIPLSDAHHDGVGSTTASGPATDPIPSGLVQRMPGTGGTPTSSNPQHARGVEPDHRAALTQADDAAALKQVLEERLKQLEMMRKALDEQAQRQESLLSRQTVTREMVDDKKREYLAALQAFQESQEMRMRLETLFQQLAQVAGEQQVLRRRQQDNNVAAQSRTHSRGDVVTITAAPDGTRPPDSRVLAIPGDRIQVARAGIIVNGAPVMELSRDFLAGLPEETWEQVVPPDHYFVAAEQRAETGITRFWGLIPVKRISGRP
jgi:signal peptidase I